MEQVVLVRVGEVLLVGFVEQALKPQIHVEAEFDQLADGDAFTLLQQRQQHVRFLNFVGLLAIRHEDRQREHHFGAGCQRENFAVAALAGADLTADFVANLARI